MVFSLFSRKDKVESRRSREVAWARTADSRPGPSPDTLAEQREVARRTEEKIDRIESEMIASAAVPRAGAIRPSTDRSNPAGAVAPGASAAGRPAAEEQGTSLLLGDMAGAMAIDVNGPALPGVLEEAAILYSNGQSQPAALVLRQALEDPDLAGYQALAWLMLLDLHQCVGDRSGFETLALDYAARFESSPPGWSEALSQSAGGRVAASAGRIDPTDPVLRFPPAPDAAFGQRIATILRSVAGRELEVDFGQLASLDSAVAESLLHLFAHFERSSSGGLVLRGAERLFAAARASIEPGRRDRSEAGWMLALRALRVLGRKQDFEDLGIEYCVTYEVSPPSWEPIGPRIRLAETPAADIALPALHCAAPQASAFALSGEVLGRMQSELQALRDFASGRGDVVVDCRGLRRMEFVAAGDLLNEVVTMRAAGRQVLFIEPNYLVYALMLVMGIQDLAEIRRRKV